MKITSHFIFLTIVFITVSNPIFAQEYSEQSAHLEKSELTPPLSISHDQEEMIYPS